MKPFKVETTFFSFDSIEDLTSDIQQLMKVAIEARLKAHADYSKFSVGAAVILDNGEIISGSNQENAAYPSGLCAERTAIFYAASKYPEAKILKMAITAGSQLKKNEKPIPPCGACRQAIAEYEVNQKMPIEIYFMGEIGPVIKSNSLSDLLPLLFDKSML
jgi:cytidine deaminase